MQLHIVPPALPQLELWPPLAPHLASARTAPGQHICILGSGEGIVTLGVTLCVCVSADANRTHKI